MTTKILFSLHHNDHLVWTSTREISPDLAKLMTNAELEAIGVEAEAALRQVLARKVLSETRPLVEQPVEQKPSKRKR